MIKLVIFTLLIPQFLFGQSFNTYSLNSCIKQLIKEHKVPGLAVGVVFTRIQYFLDGFAVLSQPYGRPKTRGAKTDKKVEFGMK